ncbi:DUF2127 domain-containing protein (plasmid) [Brasilonema octagenarum UFV-E1]|uniref:DUF2127 domain-containing protein n=1 Tax=Brasilonema sennae CENA114 TaxID=415709 RepID=A0A856MR47_9CYAN|nr:DUF2127 domain-containing protein [Brasilonema sennae]QDL12630.1 DUF2127 domain-containing protein [Brasilonema sennae CENA114]QDL19025.1 DUF2127 domain-containing protein [Brasilonema octagenarum UFV-E1]
MKNKRPPALLAIVIYKTFVASLLAVTSIALLLALKNYQNLADFSESYVLETKMTIIEWLIDKILNISPTRLKFSGIAIGVYAIVTAIEAVGLWYEKSWATLLVVGLVGISIPPEIFELIKGITILKFIVLLLNVAVFWYLLRHLMKHKK